ncbi:MAG: hypothetical protein O7B25_06360 [Gammaproteobacteria bacterium]|nr:hypothetical protein [Gammaproteobacteria bacterium]
MLMQKILSPLLVLMLGLGNLACPCAAMAADDEPGSHAHHQQQPAAPDESDCVHPGCLGDYDRISAIVPDARAVLLSASKITFDGLDAVKPKTIETPRPPLSVTSTGPPFRRLWRPADTPVRRYDTLLD